MIVKILLPLILAFIMFSLGLGLRKADFGAGATVRHWENPDEVSNESEIKRKLKRKEEAEKSGANHVATMMQRFTVGSVKFVRWLRNFIYRETGWGDALTRLTKIYATR